ncbi:MAG: hypothetical protein V5A30_06910 [Haloarculaceae archaeon]
MTLYDRVADLPLTVEGYDLSRLEGETSSDFTRVSTVFALQGPDATGYGEDVTYETADHEALLEADPDFDRFPLAGEYTLDSFSSMLDDVGLFPTKEPDRDVFRQYRRWAVESAALDLALRQADETLASALDRSYDPVSFVVSTRLGEPPTTERIERALEVHGDLEFKLDPTPEWDRDLVERVAALAPVRILDLKGLYEGTDVDSEPDPGLYDLVLETFPDAVIEDPALTDETRPLFEGHEERVSWDYPVTGVGSVENLPFEPEWLNIKPSRFGTVASLLDTVEYALEREIRLYGGGQFELGVGRRQLHALASTLYPDAPNDLAPRGYNTPEIQPDAPASPLEPPAAPEGLDWR